MFATVERALWERYGLRATEIEKSSAGAGSDTYFATCEAGKVVVKYPDVSEMNNPQAEAELCAHLRKRGLRVSEFLRDTDGGFVSRDGEGRAFHVQKFVFGATYAPHTAPDWLLGEAAGTLGRIHAALRDYRGLPVGIGADFFRYMTPARARESYRETLKTAERLGDEAAVCDLRYRLGLTERLPDYRFDLEKLTCQASHGDYAIGQWICGPDKIEAVIDWTTACVHPVVWEIFRSYVYAAPACRRGEIEADGLIDYVGRYLRYARLNDYDIAAMVDLFYYQIAVCDYCGQYYHSQAANRHIFRMQAAFSTRMMGWLEENGAALTERLRETFAP